MHIQLYKMKGSAISLFKIDFGYYIFDLKKTGGEYKREKKNDGNKSEIMKKNGRYLIE